MGGDHDGDQVLLIWDQEMPGFLCFSMTQTLTPRCSGAPHPYAGFPCRKMLEWACLLRTPVSCEVSRS